MSGFDIEELWATAYAYGLMVQEAERDHKQHATFPSTTTQSAVFAPCAKAYSVGTHVPIFGLLRIFSASSTLSKNTLSTVSLPLLIPPLMFLPPFTLV